MNQANKIIKYLAIAFGIFLVVTIISAIMGGILSIGSIFTNDKLTDLKQLEINDDFKKINIEVNSININIKKGETFKVETNNKYIRHNVKDGVLNIVENKINLYKKDSTDLIIYIPDTIYDYVSIENGAGKVYIETLNTKKLNLDLGAGKVEILNMEVLDEAEMNGGAGEISINNGNINNLDFDMGVGKATITSAIMGNSEISAGVGELKLTLYGKKEDYKIEAKKGLGTFKIDNEDVSENTYGSGNNKIIVEGGIGTVNIKYTLRLEIHDFVYFTRTYHILNITPSQEENTYYVTLQQFQGEVDTVLIKNLKQNLEIGKNYEFKFEKDCSLKIEDNIDSIFENTRISKITETNKEGLEQVQDSIR